MAVVLPELKRHLNVVVLYSFHIPSFCSSSSITKFTHWYLLVIIKIRYTDKQFHLEMSYGKNI